MGKTNLLPSQMLYVNQMPAFHHALSNIRIRSIMRPKVILSLTALALLVALLTPLLGPLVDHHFAERQPGHLHIYLGGVPVQHLHDHQAYHTHHDPTVDSIGTEAAAPVLENGVIFMPQEGEGLSVSTVGMTLALLSTIIAIALPSLLTLQSLQSPRAMCGILLSPDPPPPRVAS